MTIRSILQEVAEKHKVACEELLQDIRFPHVVRARHELFYRARTESGKRLSIIERETNHNRSTIISGSRTHARRNGLESKGA